MQLKSLIIIIGFSFAALGTAIADVDKESIERGRGAGSQD